jgi:hypothetical protein
LALRLSWPIIFKSNLSCNEIVLHSCTDLSSVACGQLEAKNYRQPYPCKIRLAASREKASTEGTTARPDVEDELVIGLGIAATKARSDDKVLPACAELISRPVLE